MLGVEPEDQHLTEIVDFEVNAVDVNLPEAGSDSVTLILHYNATQPTASLLLETLGADLVTCNQIGCGSFETTRSYFLAFDSKNLKKQALRISG